jgi:hypothetical protein
VSAREELLEAEAIEEPVAEGAVEAPTRHLPDRRQRGEELEAWKGEVRTAAIAAAGGLVAGVATVAAVNAARAVGSRRPRSRVLRRGSRRERAVDVVASRSFLIDVHVLGR